MSRVRATGREGRTKGGALIAIAVALSVTLAGCAQIRTTSDDIIAATHAQTLPIDPASPVAADVARAEKIEGPVPSFATVPPKPTDVRSADAYRSQVVDVVGDRRSLARWEAANPPGVNDTERYAEAQRRTLAGQTPVAAAHGAESDSFARRLREAAEAPPPRSAPMTTAKKPAEKTKTAPSAY